MARRSFLVLAMAAVILASSWTWWSSSTPQAATPTPAEEPTPIDATRGEEHARGTGPAPVLSEPAAPARTSAARLQIVCIDSVSRAAIAGAAVSCPDGVGRSADAQGMLWITRADVGAAPVRVNARGYATRELALDERAFEQGESVVCALDPVVDAGERASFEVVFVLAGPRSSDSFELVVERAAAAAARSGHDSEPSRGRFEGRASFDADMRARLDGLPAGVELVGRVLRSRNVVHSASLGPVLAPGEVRRTTWHSELAALHVDARESNGAPVADLEVWLVRGAGAPGLDFFGRLERPIHVGRTDTRGRCTLGDLEPGSWRVGPAPWPADAARVPDDSPCALAQRVDVRGGSETTVELLVRRGRFIRGRVLGPGGEPHPTGIVLAYAEDRSLATADVGTDGRFQLGPLPPGSYKLSVIQTSDRELTSPVVEARAGDDAVALQLATGASIRGRVNGIEPGGADLPWLQLRGDGLLVGYSVRCSEDGSFRFDELTDAVYTLTATQNGGWIAARSGITVRGGQSLTGIDLQLQPAAKLVLERATSAPIRVRILHGGDVVDHALLNDDEPQTRLLIPGATVIEVLSATDAERERHALTLAPRETRKLTVGGGG